MIEQKRIIKVKILRGTEKSGKRKERYQVYEVPLGFMMSVLDVLDYIYENIDGSLAYYSHTACRRGVCGRCALMINGVARLACQTPVNGDITVEPLPKLTVIRDLVHST